MDTVRKKYCKYIFVKQGKGKEYLDFVSSKPGPNLTYKLASINTNFKFVQKLKKN